MKTTISLIDQFPKKDSFKPLGLRLLPQDAKRAKRGDPRACTLARAVKRATGADLVLIFRSSAYVVMDGIAWRYTVPGDVVRDVIDPLDNGEEPKPGFYTLTVPSESAKLGAATKRRDKLTQERAMGEASATQSVEYKQRKGRTLDPRRVFPLD